MLNPNPTPAVTTRRVAVIGNPNTGKTTLFNSLTGLSQKVGNYPGVTVEKKVGRMADGIELVDLPGTYSLAAFSPDEMVAVDVLLGERRGEADVAAAVVVVDAGNLPRNLFLVTQVMETGVPVVVALNMVDSAESEGVTVDAAGLARELRLPVVTTIASRRKGVDELRAAVEGAIDAPAPEPRWTWPSEIEAEVDPLATETGVRPFLVRRAILDAGGAAEVRLVERAGDGVLARLSEARDRIRDATGVTPAALEAQMRYGWIGRATERLVTRREVARSVTDRLDRYLTHRLFGSLAFVIVMGAVFMSIFQWAGPFMDLIGGAFDGLGALVTQAFAGTSLAGGVLESLIVDGVIAGVGGVLVFLPQIVFLFLFIAVLEDCGYLSRAAFLMDRLLRFCGLSGHSFIPLLSSFACAVPGVMSTRTIGDRRDRLVTILVAPLMSCSARIPVYALLIAAFVPRRIVAGFLPLQGTIFTAMYFVGILVAIPMAILLKKTLLRGPTHPFVMELPPYRWPAGRSVILRVYQRAKSFILRAGTVIFAFAIVVWALGTFPRDDAVLARADAARAEAQAGLAGTALDARLAAIDAHESSELLERSALGRMGRAIEPAVRPLGWDWRIGMAAIASFPAREIVVSTLGVIFDLGAKRGGADEEAGLARAIRSAKRPDGTKLFTLPVALSLMVFFALCAQCMATLATIRRETNSWRWPIFTFAYMTALAWIGALVTYQVASALAA